MKNFVWVVATIALVVACAIFAGFYLLHDTKLEEQATLRVEAIKLLMQLVLVGVVGGVITWTLNERSKFKERAAAEEVRRKDREREDAQKLTVRREALNGLRKAADARIVAA